MKLLDSISELRARGRPVAVAQFMLHRAETRARQRRLRRTYHRRIASEVHSELKLPKLDPPGPSRLPPQLSASAEAIAREADRALAHEIDLLGSGWTALGEQIDWHRDFKSGYVWPRAFYQDLEVTRLSDASDAKVPWELSRGHHLLGLARAAVLFDRPDYAEELSSQLHDWIEQNPPGCGINWANAMECGIRATNWVWALATLRSGGMLTASLADAAAASLGQHGRHVAANLEGSPLLRSNHYIADILGLLVIASALPSHPDSGRWRRYARRAFEREVRRQVLPDGVGFEASLPYHGLVLEMLVLAWRIAELDGAPLSPAFRARVEGMLEASRGLRHPNGRIPQFGDSDSGRVLPLHAARPPTHDHLLWLGAAALGRARPLEGDPHPEVAWTLGLDPWEAARSRPLDGTPPPRAFPAAGLHVLRNESAHVVVRAGDVGQAGNGGHGHNDLLSFELSYMNDPLIVDRGTFVYTADPSARNAYRSSASHNAVTVRGREVNPIDPSLLFKLRQHAQPSLELWSFDGIQTCWQASHDGYRDLQPGIRVRRRMDLKHGTAALVVRDTLLAENGATVPSGRAVDVCSSIHLAPGSSCRWLAPDQLMIWRDEVVAEVRFAGFMSVAVEQTTVSDRYGVDRESAVVRARTEGDLPLEFGYEIELSRVRDRESSPGAARHSR